MIKEIVKGDEFVIGHKEDRRRTTDSLLIWEERRNEIRITAASDEGVAVCAL